MGLAVAALSACAPPPAVTAARRATVEVANPCPDTVQVFVDHDWLGDVAPGTRMRYGHIRPGHHLVEIKRPDPPHSVRMEMDLHSGQVVVIDIPLRHGDVAQVVPAGLGDVRIENRLPYDVEISGIERRLGRVLAGETRVFYGLEEGSWNLVARVFHARLTVASVLGVRAGQTTEWVVDLPRGRIRLVNEGQETALVRIDTDSSLAGSAISLAPGEEVVVEGIIEGRHQLEAVAKESLLAERRFVDVEAEQTTEWILSAPDAGVDVANESDEPVELSIDGEVLATIAAGDVRRLERVRPGPRLLTAGGLRTGLRYELPLVLWAGQTFRWTLRSDRGAVAVTNRSSEALVLLVPGRPELQIAAGQTLYVSDLLVGPVSLRAFGATSRRTFESELTVSAAKMAEWAVEGGRSRLVIHSARNDQVEIWLEGSRVGDLEPKGVLVVDAIIPGQRRLEARASQARWGARYNLEIPVDGELIHIVHRPEFLVRVNNRSGEALDLSPVLGAVHRVMEEDAVAEFSVPPGAWSVELRGRRTGVVWRERLEGLDGTTHEWLVEPRLGAFHVFNRRPEPVAIFVDGLEKAEIPAHTDALVKDIPIGTRELWARGRHSGHEIRAELPLGDTRPAPFEVLIEFASLRVQNLAEEPIAVEVDGRPYGQLPANSEAAFGKITPNRHRVTATGLKSGRRYEVEVEFGEARLHRWRVPEEAGAVTVVNRRTEPISLARGGKFAADVAPRASFETSAPEGQQIFTATSKGASGVARQALVVQPQQSYEWQVQPHTSSLHVTNRTAYTLALRANGLMIGRAYAGDTTVFSQMPAGPVRFTAHPEDAPRDAPSQSWFLQLQVPAGGDVLWPIEPATALQPEDPVPPVLPTTATE